MELFQMKEDELTFQLIVESSPCSIILIDKEETIVYVNRKAEELFGYKKTEFLGQSMKLILPARKYPKYSGIFHKILGSDGGSKGNVYDEVLAQKKDGSEILVEIGLNTIEIKKEGVLLISMNDITERKKSEERFRLVVQAAPNAMILVNNKGVITLVNRQTEVLFGYTNKELIGNKIEMLIPERFSGDHPNLRSKFFAHPETRPMGEGRDLFARKKNGTEIPVEIGLNPVETIEGQMVVASIIDITERKSQEATIKKHILELKLKNKEQEQFSYIASHDLREPLLTISNFVGLFHKKYSGKIDEEADQYIRYIEQATEKMKSLVKDLLDYSIIEKNFTFSEVDLNRLLVEVIDELHPAIKEERAKISFSVLPVINGSALKLKELFQNLISNSLKFRKKDVAPEIEINVEESPVQYIFSIKDNGIGIEEKYLDKLFVVFQRLNNANEFMGTGIGLAICKKIIDLHGGEIWVESKINEGSTIYFSINKQNFGKY
jgi:PAS domain S-box-containing protein